MHANIQNELFHLNFVEENIHQYFIEVSCLQNNYSIMFRALKVFFAFICLVLSIQAVVAATDVDNVTGASVTDPRVNPPTQTTPTAVLNGPVVFASQPSAVSANLRKKEENDVELEGM